MPTTYGLEDRLAEFLQQKHLAGARLIVAVSGGPDSLALLVALARLRQPFRLDLHVAHLDHGLRPESRADAVYVRRVCRRLRVPLTVRRQDVEAQRIAQRSSLEEAARHARYTFLGEVMREAGAAMVLTGHTADDQAETVLMHVLRGTGLAGLRGMQPVTRLRLQGAREVIVGRPLLPVWRTETESYCRMHRLRPRQDVTNQDMALLRNRLRLDTLPSLESTWPGAREALLEMSGAAQEAYDYLDQAAAAARQWVARRQEDAIFMDRAALNELHSAVRTVLLQQVVRALVGDPPPLERTHIRAVTGLLAISRGERSLDLPRGLRFTVSYGEAVLSLGGPPCPLPILQAGRLAAPGETRLGGWRFWVCEQEDAIRVEAGPLEDERTWGLAPFPLSVRLRREQTAGGLTVRKRQPGDLVRLRGGARKVQDVLVDAKVPRWWRDRVPLLCRADTGEVLWVMGAHPTPSSSSSGEKCQPAVLQQGEI